jgi:hypothetical protein
MIEGARGTARARGLPETDQELSQQISDNTRRT